MQHERYDAVVVGAGPNGLAAAITLARAGRRVAIFEARPTIGGGSRTSELTLPGFRHDVCSAIHPLGVSSPFFRELPLDSHGLRWVWPPAALAHPLDDGTAVLVYRDLTKTARQANLGRDASAYRRLFGPVVRDWPLLERSLLGPFRLPGHPFALARFGLRALMPAGLLVRLAFRGTRARAVFGGMCAHSMLPLSTPGTAAIGLVLGTLAHRVGWPMAEGGSQSIVDAMGAYLRSMGGEIFTGVEVESMADLPKAQAYLFDLTPRQLVRIAGERLPPGYKRRLAKFRYGTGTFKVDYALDGPVPWRASECAQAATVHLGGTLEEIEASEKAVWEGKHPDRPFVLVAQQSLFDPSRAPEGKHTLWAYCHVPNGSIENMAERIESQIERFAPGFRSRVLARHLMGTREIEAYNPNYIGGDINGGAQDLLQLYTRPVARLDPYSTPNPRIFICSSSTPPGGGVHGMCGYHAARSALRA